MKEIKIIMNNLKKVFTFGVVLATIVWSMGVAALVPVASAATLSGGDTIKGSFDAVYFNAEDGNRYVYPQDKYYFTWQYDFSGVIIITDAELAAIPLAGNVVTRYGTKLVKIQSIPKVFAVGRDGKLYWVNSEASAVTLFGSDWGGRVIDVSDAFWPNYTDTGVELDGTWYPDGFLLKAAGSPDVYLIWDGMKRRIASEAAFYANRFYWEYVCETTQAVLDSYSDGSEVTGGEADLVDDSQGGGAVIPGPGTGGALSVALAPDTPAAKSVPDSAIDIPAVKINFTATGGDVKVSKISFLRSGLSTDALIAAAKLYENGTMVGTSQTLNADHKAVFNVSGGWTVPDGVTNPLELKFDGPGFGGGTGEVVFGIESASDIVSNASSVNGAFPINGNTMTITMINVGGLTVDNGTLQPTGTPTVDIDAVDHMFVHMKLWANAVEDVNIDYITLMRGTASSFITSDLDELELYNTTAGMSYGTADWTTDDKLVWATPGLSVTQGNYVEIGGRADVVGGSGRTVGFDIWDGSAWTIQATGAMYGYGVPLTAGTWAGVGPLTTINQGTVTVSKGSNAPATGNIPVGSSDVEICSFDFLVKGEDVRFGQMAVTVTGIGGAETVNDITLLRILDDTGTVLGGPVNLTGAWPTFTGTFSSSFELMSGTDEVFVTGKLANGTAGRQYQVSMNPATALTNVKGLTSNKTITPTPNAVINCNVMTAQGPALNADMGANPIAGTVIAGSQNHEMANIELDATGSGEDIKVTSITITNWGTETWANLNNFELWDGLVQIGETEQYSATAPETVVFNIDDGFIASMTDIENLALLVDNTNPTATNTFIANVTAVTAVGDDSGVAGTLTLPGTLSPVQTYQANGELRVTLDADTPVAAQLVAGSSGNPVFKYKLEARYEDVDVTKISVFAGQMANTAAGAVNCAANVSDVTLWDGATQLGASVPLDPVTCLGVLNLTSGTLVVPQDGSMVLTGEVGLKDKTQLTSGDDFVMGIADAATQTGANWSNWAAGGNDTYLMEAVGMDSGAALQTVDTIDDTWGNPVVPGLVYGGNDFYQYDGLLTVTKNVNSPGGSATGAPDQEALRLDLTATGDDITVNNMEFYFGGTIAGGGVNATELRTLDDSVVYWSGTVLAGIMGGYDDVLGDGGWNSTLAVSSGTTKSIKLITDTQGSVNPQSFTASLTGDLAVTSVTQRGIEWYDTELGAPGVDSALTKETPVNGNTFTY